MGGGEINYSTDEVEIGTWIDGRPLYRKIYNVTSVSAIDTYSTVVDITSLNVSELVSLHALLLEISGKWHELPERQSLVYVTGGAKYINMYTNDGAYVSKPLTITIEYTKT